MRGSLVVLALVVVGGGCESPRSESQPDAGPDASACGSPHVNQGQQCYTGPAGTMGVGACHPGSWLCVDGVFGCVGQGAPAAEVCDFHDNDCNGLVDDGVIPTEEVCDQIDNDCNGVADDGLVGEGCVRCDLCPPERHKAPVVSCSAVASDGGAMPDAGVPNDAGVVNDAAVPNDAAISPDGGTECELPPSECDGRWLIFWTNGRCVDGRCQWAQDYEYCPEGCSQYGCEASFT